MDRIFTTFRSRYNKENFKKSRNIARIRTEGFRRNGFTTGVSKLSVWNPKIDSDRRDKIDTDRPRLYSKEVEYNKRQTADIPSFRRRSNPEGEVLSGEKPREIDQPLMLLTVERTRKITTMKIHGYQRRDNGRIGVISSLQFLSQSIDSPRCGEKKNSPYEQLSISSVRSGKREEGRWILSCTKLRRATRKFGGRQISEEEFQAEIRYLRGSWTDEIALQIFALEKREGSCNQALKDRRESLSSRHCWYNGSLCPSQGLFSKNYFYAESKCSERGLLLKRL